MADSTAAPAVRVGVLLDGRPDDLGEWLATGAAFDAAGADALWVDLAGAPDLDPLAAAAALAAVTYRSLLVVAHPAGAAPDRTLATVERLSRGRLRLADRAGQWLRVPPPDSRATWRAVVADAAGRGAAGSDAAGSGAGVPGVAGLLVPADPRLLDLLRNPADPAGRHDLHLAQG